MSDGPLTNYTVIQNHRYLIISSVFPPDIIGGAEVSAKNLAQWMQRQGADVGVLTTAKSPDEVCDGVEIDGLKVWRVWMPRMYPQFYFAKAKWWQKPIWHLQDHFDPRNRKIVARVLDAFKPDFVNIHVIQGIGYNALSEIAKRKIHVTYFLHDLALACFRMSMFKNGKECVGQCAGCKVSSAYKLHEIKKIADLRFCSPSRANLEKLAHYLPIKNWPHTAIINANQYLSPKVERSASDVFRILYIGRLHSSKGVNIMLDAARNLAERHKLKVTIAGSGPDEAALRAEYGKFPWCEFVGHVSQQAISNLMINSDILCVPSVWSEPLGGVVIHALGNGLPVLGSNKGGIPEIIEHNKNGMLLPAGDVPAWQNALEQVISEPSTLAEWRDYALKNSYKFDQDYLGNKILSFIYEPEAKAQALKPRDSFLRAECRKNALGQSDRL